MLGIAFKIQNCFSYWYVKSWTKKEFLVLTLQHLVNTVNTWLLYCLHIALWPILFKRTHTHTHARTHYSWHTKPGLQEWLFSLFWNCILQYCCDYSVTLMNSCNLVWSVKRIISVLVLDIMKRGLAWNLIVTLNCSIEAQRLIFR